MIKRQEQQWATDSAGTRAALLGAIGCLVLSLAFGLFFGALAVQQHRTYLTHGLDLGNVDQALWNTAQGRFLQFTLMAPIESRLALHVEPILLLFVPFYWLNLGGPELLLVAQAFIVALGAWPVYQLTISNYQLINKGSQSTNQSQRVARRSRYLVYLLALMFAAVYLMLPTLQSAVLFDFHAVTLAPTFLLFAVLALDRRRYRLYFLFIILALASKEDMPLVVAMLGLYAGIAYRRWRLAGLTAGLSLVWFVTAVLIIQPRFASGGNIQLERYAWLGATPSEMVRTVMTSPGVLIDHLFYQVDLMGYLGSLFFPTAFLAVFSPLTLLPMLPTLAVNLLSDNPFTWRLEDFHYGAPLAPFLILSALYGVRHLSEWVARRAAAGASAGPGVPAFVSIVLLTLLVVVFATIYHVNRGYTPLARPFVWPRVSQHHRQLDQILDAVPAAATVFAQSNLAPHLTQRQLIYSDFAYFTDPAFPAREEVTDLVLDVTSLENFGSLHEFLQQRLADRDDYQLVAAQDGILHLQRSPPARSSDGQVGSGQAPSSGSTSQAWLPGSFHTFVRPGSPLDYELAVDFGRSMRLRGYSLHVDRQEEIQVTVDLELLQSPDSLKPVLYLLDSSGRPTGATVDLQPALVWYPVEQWSTGRRVRVRFNTLPWYTRQTPAYGLALGVVAGSDVWAEAARLRPSIVQPTDLAMGLPAAGSLLELGRFEQHWGMPEGGPRPRQYTPPAIANPLEADFGDKIKLLGYGQPHMSHNQISGPELSLSLYWQAVSTPESLTRFVHYVGPDGRLYGQHDSVPDDGNYPTDLWQPGEVVVETVTFPVERERPGGSYSLHVGLYRSPAGERLRLEAGQDHVEIPLLGAP